MTRNRTRNDRKNIYLPGKKRRPERKARDLANTLAGDLIGAFVTIKNWFNPPKQEPRHKCERPGSQAYYADHEHSREIERHQHQSSYSNSMRTFVEPEHG